MAAQTEAKSRPGLRQGVVNEFTLFFNVKPGQGQQIRKTLAGGSFEEKSGPK